MFKPNKKTKFSSIQTRAFGILVLSLLVIQATTSVNAFKLETIVFPVAVIVSVSNTSMLLNSEDFFKNQNHLFATGLAVWELRAKQVNGWTVKSVSQDYTSFRVIPKLTVFNLGPTSGATATTATRVEAKNRAKFLSLELPRGQLYGKFVAIVITTPRDYGEPLMFTTSNEEIGALVGQPEGPCLLFFTSVADSRQFNDGIRQLHPHSFGTLVPNVFGRDIGRLVLTSHAANQVSNNGGTNGDTNKKLNFLVISANTSSSQAVVIDTVSSSFEVGLEASPLLTSPADVQHQAQQSLTWPVLYWSSNKPTDLAILANQVAQVNPDILILICLSTEISIGSELLKLWKDIGWRSKALAIPGAGLPVVWKTDPVTNEIEASEYNYVHAIGAYQWSRVLKGDGWYVDPKLSALLYTDNEYASFDDVVSTELFTSNTTSVETSDSSGVSSSTTDSPEMFAQYLKQYFPKYSNLLDPIAAAIGYLPGLVLQSASQLGCNQLYSNTSLGPLGPSGPFGLASLCTTKLMGAAVSRIYKNSMFGRLSFALGQINPVSFVVRQVSIRLESYLISPLTISQQILQFPAATWAELKDTLFVKYNGYLVAFAVLVGLIGSAGTIMLYGWLTQAKKRANLTLGHKTTAMFPLTLMATTSILTVTLTCTEMIFITSISFSNFFDNQSIMGYSKLRIVLLFVINFLLSLITLAIMYTFTSKSESYDQYLNRNHSSLAADAVSSFQNQAQSLQSLQKSLVELTGSAGEQPPIIKEGERKTPRPAFENRVAVIKDEKLERPPTPRIGHTIAPDNKSTLELTRASVAVAAPPKRGPTFDKHLTLKSMSSSNNNNYDFDSKGVRIPSADSIKGSATHVLLIGQQIVAGFPLAIANLTCALLIVYSINGNVSQMIEPVYCLGPFLTSWIMSAGFTFLLFWPKFDTWRLPTGSLCLTLNIIVTCAWIERYVSWTRNLTREPTILKSTSLLDGSNGSNGDSGSDNNLSLYEMLATAIVSFMIIFLSAFGLSVYMYRGAVGDVKATLKRERLARRQAKALAKKTQIQLDKLLVLAPFELTNSAPKISQGSMKSLLDDKLKPLAETLKFDHVCNNQDAMFHFVTCVVPSHDRIHPLFIYYVDMFKKLMKQQEYESEDPDFQYINVESETGQLIRKIIIGMKNHFLTRDGINISDNLLKSITPNKLSISELKSNVFDDLYKDVKRSVMTNQWLRITNREKNYLSDLVYDTTGNNNGQQQQQTNDLLNNIFGTTNNNADGANGTDKPALASLSFDGHEGREGNDHYLPGSFRPKPDHKQTESVAMM